MGISILAESPDAVKELFVNPEDYEVKGQTSGFKMAAFLGRKINKICTTRLLSDSGKQSYQ